MRLKEPLLRGLCTPHLMQLMVSPVLPSPSKGDPPFLDLYRKPSLEISVFSGRDIVFVDLDKSVFSQIYRLTSCKRRKKPSKR